MKLKYYLRGMGIGIILTAIVMGFALGGRRSAISDAEVIKRAKALGMVEAGAEVLSEMSTETSSLDNEEVPQTPTIGEALTDEETNASASDTSLDEAGKEISQEVDETVTDSGESVPDVAEEEKETEDQTGEAEDPDIKGDAGETGVTTDTADASDATTESSADASTESATDTNTDIPTGGKTVTIPKGLGSEGVAQILVREGFIDDAASFNKYLVDNRKDRVIRSGVKSIPEGATYQQIADIITR